MPQAMRGWGGAVRFCRPTGAVAALLALSSVLCPLSFVPCPLSLASAQVKGQGTKDKGQKAVAAAGAEKGTLLVRWPSDKPWKAAAPREPLYAGEPLLAPPGFVARVDTGKPNPKLKLELVGNLPGLYRTQSLESLVTLHSAKDAEIDLTLERGRILLSRVGDKGGTPRCRVRFAKVQWILELTDPATSVAISLKVHRFPLTD